MLLCLYLGMDSLVGEHHSLDNTLHHNKLTGSRRSTSPGSTARYTLHRRIFAVQTHQANVYTYGLVLPSRPSLQDPSRHCPFTFPLTRCERKYSFPFVQNIVVHLLFKYVRVFFQVLYSKSLVQPSNWQIDINL